MNTPQLRESAVADTASTANNRGWRKTPSAAPAPTGEADATKTTRSDQTIRWASTSSAGTAATALK